MGLRGHKRWCEGRGAKVEDAEFVGDGSGMSPQQQGWVTRRANASTGGSNPHMGRGARNAHKEVDPDEDIDDILVERTTRPRRSVWPNPRPFGEPLSIFSDPECGCQSASNLNRDDDIRPAKLAVASSGVWNFCSLSVAAVRNLLMCCLLGTLCFCRRQVRERQTEPGKRSSYTRPTAGGCDATAPQGS